MIDVADDSARGKRTIIETLFRKAEVHPNQIFGSFCMTDEPANGFHDFTFAQLANAVDACSWLVKDSFGESDTFEPLLYFGVEDYRYTIMLYAAIKCGYKALFINPKYPLENILNIMRQTKCNKILYAEELSSLVVTVGQHIEDLLAQSMAPPLHWLNCDSRSFPFHKTWETSKEDPIIVLHSSGTTGAPKPITYSNAWIAVQDTYGKVLTFNDTFSGGNTYSQFPQCHYGGILYTNLRPLLSQYAASVLGPTSTTGRTAAQVAIEILKLKDVKSLAATPFLLETIVGTAGGMQALQNLNSVIFAGGPLRTEVGAQIVEQRITLASSYGSTELGSCPVVLPDPQQWQWIQFDPDIHATLEPTNDGQGTHELVFADEGDAINRRRGTYWSLAVPSYRTKDLFVQHPNNSLLWKYFGRTDDIIVLANAGKFNPIPIENAVAASPSLSGVLVAGMNRYPACILVEPKDTVADHRTFLETIKPSITEANNLLRADSRIPLDMIGVLKPEGLVRGLKGQVIRKSTVEVYKELIESLYEAREQRSTAGHKSWDES